LDCKRRKTNRKISKEFSEVESLYIADGHHRAAAAATIARVRRSKDKSVVSVKEYESVLAVFFPHTQLKVMDYNRAVKDLNGLTSEKFIEKISAFFTVTENFTARSPQKLHDLGMYLEGKWYKITVKKVFITKMIR